MNFCLPLQIQLSSEERRVLGKFQSADEALYKHFSQRFDTRVEAFGKNRMRTKVEELRYGRTWTKYTRQHVLLWWAMQFCYLRTRADKPLLEGSHFEDNRTVC